MLGHEASDDFRTPDLALDLRSAQWVRSDFIQLVAKEQFTHIITSIPQSDIFFDWVGRRRAARPWFVFAHGQPFPVAGQAPHLKAVAWRNAWRRSARHADGVLAVSRKIAENVEFWTGRRPFVVPPIAPSIDRNISTNALENVGFVGRLSYEKDPMLFGAIASRMPDFKFHVFGTGHLLGEMRTWGKHLHFHGFVRAQERIYSRLQMVLITSRSEGLPLVVLEAAAYGVVPLCADVGGIREAIHPSLRSQLLIPEDQRSRPSVWEHRVRSINSVEGLQRARDLQSQWVREHYGEDVSVQAMRQGLGL
jgi:glycosyltransferase involved in cell wall biosynthesis